jgi:hypothetical protein
MITFSLFCREPELIQLTKTALESEFGDELEFINLSEPKAINFHLYYEMPSFVLFDLDDK